MKTFFSSGRKYITALTNSSPDPIETKIEGFANLESGWHFGEGHPPSIKIINTAKKIYRIGKYMGLKSNTFPSIDKGITIVFYGSNNHSIEISIENDNQITISYEIGYGFEFEEEFFEENTTIETVRAQCKKLSPLRKQNLLESSTQGYLIKGEVASQVIVSKNHQETEGSPSLMGFVSSKPMIPQYVHI